MPGTPWIAGATAVAVIGGAMTGMTLDTTPIERFSDPLETIPRHKMAAFDRKPHVDTPDHYEMKTPEGTLSIAEVVTRRMRLNPPEWQVDAYSYAQEAYLPGDDRLSEAAGDYAHSGQPEPAPVPYRPADAQPIELPGEPSAMLHLAGTQDTSATARGGPKVVDVSAELAASN